MLIAIIVLLVLILSVLVAAYVTFFLCFYSTKKQKANFADPTSPLVGDEYTDFNPKVMAAVERVLKLPFEEVSVTSHDGLKLHGKYFHNGDGLPLEIFFHGYRSAGLRDGSGAVELAPKAGFNLLVVDQRGAGLSEGSVISFGVLEKEDAKVWIDYAINRFGKEVQIILAGVSMGAATVLMASSQNLPENVRAITADCPYSSQSEIIAKVCGDIKIPARLAMPFIRLGARLYGHFDLSSETPEEAVAKTTIPIFFVHGDADGFVPCEMSQRMHEKCASKKAMYLAPDSPHGVSFVAHYPEYVEHLKGFFEEAGLELGWKG